MRHNDDLPEQLKALAHPARLAILRVLADRGSCVCGAVVQCMGLAQSTVSEHLRILKQAGLVRGTIDGPRSCYCLDPQGVSALRQALDEYLSSLERTSKCGQPLSEEMAP